MYRVRLRFSIRSAFCVLAVCMLVACAGIEDKTADRYMAAGYQNETAGNLSAAAEDYRRAHINTQMSGISDEYIASTAGEYARVECKLGNIAEAQKAYEFAEIQMKKAYEQAMSSKDVAELSRVTYNYALLERDMCHLPESEALQLKALDLEQELQQGKGDAIMSKRLCELGNFYFELGNWIKSSEYFKKCDAIVDRWQYRGADHMYVLEEYHSALLHAGDRDEAAAIEYKIATYKAQGIKSRSPWLHPACAGMAAAGASASSGKSETLCPTTAVQF
jgi:hypothetical protein